MGREGLIIGLVGGVAALVVSVIVAFVIVSNVATVDDNIVANIKVTVINETGGWVNATTYTLNKAGVKGFSSPVIISAVNTTSDLPIVVSGNITVSSAGVVSNASDIEWLDVSFVYTYKWTPTTKTTDDMVTNMTIGVDNVSAKVPTALKLAAIILVLGILMLLWVMYRKNTAGGGAEL